MRFAALILLVACVTKDGTSAVPVTDSSPLTTPTSSAGTPAGTASTSTGTTSGSTATTPDFRVRGPFATTATDDSVAVDSCTMEYTTYVPQGTTPAALAVLSHGFQRNRSHVSDLADHWASWGLAVVTPDLCHATAFDTDHVQNGVDLRDLAAALRGSAPVLYAGHSAGGLATWLAAADDPAAVAHFGLDPVDSAGLGSAIVGTHGIPTYALLAEPSLCNSQSNTEGWYGAGPDARALRLSGSGHCDFESPTDALCTAFCAGAGDEKVLPQIIFSTSTAFALWQTGLDPSGELWWTPGEPWFDLISTAATEI